MNNVMIRGHLAALLSGTKTVDDLQADGSPEALEAITISSKNFNEVTMNARDIASAMNSTFVTKIKAGAFKELKRACVGIDCIMLLLGKKVEVKIAWDWSRQGEVWLHILTPLPNGGNGYRLPLEAVLQNRDASQCRKLVKWVLDRADITKSLTS